MLKFPGGGLQFGEGPREALMRELQEELSMDFSIGEHVHTTDFFSLSAFDSRHQVLGIYYLVSDADDLIHPLTYDAGLSFSNGEIRFRWVSIGEADSLEMTFPTDRQALKVFLEKVETGQITFPEKSQPS